MRNCVCPSTYLVVPFLDRKRMRNSKPVTVNFEVRGLAVNIPTRLDVVGESVCGRTQLTMQETAVP